MPYALYARKSSESEDRQVQSIDDQVRIGEGLCRTRGLALSQTLTESQSAKAPGRPHFARLLALLDGGDVDGIVCWNLNRLFRNSVDMAAIQYRLQTGAIRSIVTPERDYFPEDNMLLFYVEAGMSNQYVLDLSKNVKRGLESKIAKGWFPHRAPEGYRNNKEDHTIEPDGDRFTLLRTAWDLMLTGAYTVPQVRAELTQWGYRTDGDGRRRSHPIGRSALYNLFDNPFYCGEFRHGGALHKGAHVPMVTRDEFERVQRIMGKEHHSQPKKKEFPFTGLISCGICGCLVTAEDKVKRKSSGRTKTYRYYHCTGNKGCSKQSVQEEYIEERIQEVLERCTLPAETAEWIERTMERWVRELPGTEEAKAGRLAESLKKARRRLDRLFEMRVDGEVGKEEFQERKERLEAEVRELEAERRRTQGRAERDQAYLSNAVDFCVRAYGRFTDGGLREKREVASLLGVKYVLTLGKLEIEPHPLLTVLGTFEPMDNGSQSTKRTQASGLNPSWLDRWDNIRTLLDGSDMLFSRLPVLPSSLPC